jgi:hypothetical protein
MIGQCRDVYSLLEAVLIGDTTGSFHLQLKVCNIDFNIQDKWKLSSIRAAELFTPLQLPVCFLILDRTQRMEKVLKSTFPTDNSGLLGLVELVLSEEGLYNSLKAQFFVLPVETSAILDKTFPRDVPGSVETLFNFRVCFLGSLGNQEFLSSDQLRVVCRDIISRVTGLSWKLDKLRLETCLDQVLRLDIGLDPCALVFATIVELLVKSECDVDLLARFIESINPRFQFSSAGLLWIEAILLVNINDAIIASRTGSAGGNAMYVALMGNGDAMRRVSRFCGLFTKSVIKRVGDMDEEIRKGMIACCGRLFSQFQVLSDLAKSPLDVSLVFMCANTNRNLRASWGHGCGSLSTYCCFMCHLLMIIKLDARSWRGLNV